MRKGGGVEKDVDDDFECFERRAREEVFCRFVESSRGDHLSS